MPDEGARASIPETSRPATLQGLGLVGVAFFVLFLTLVSGSVFPIRLLEPSWQAEVAARLINSAPFALVGLALHQIAVALNPLDKTLRNRHKRFAQRALAASVGFLLLLPLQTSAILRQASNLQDVRSARIAKAERRLADLRRSVVDAASNADLVSRLQELSGPVLGPADVAQPLPLLKAQVNAVLDQAALQILRERQSNPPIRRLSLLPNLLANAISCLTLTIAFAALSRRPGAYRSPLQELQSAWERRNVYRQARRRSNPLQDLLDRISLLFMR